MSYIGNEPIVSATRTVTETTASAGQTTFTADGGYTVGKIDVKVNGAELQTSDFTATNGSTVVLNQACAAGDDVKLVAWGTFSVNNLSGANINDASITAAKFASGQTPSFNGITFPATQSASSDANTLDDYEEGSWTPIDASGAGLSLTVVSANYVKVGRIVTVHTYLNYPTTASGSQAILGGFPFTSTASNSYFYGSGRLGTPNVIGAVQLNTNSTEAYFYAVASTALTNANLSNSYVLFTMTYLAAS